MRLAHNCPNCGRPADGVRGVNDDGIHDEGELNNGAVGLCLGCGEWMVYEPAGMRRPTDNELAEIADNKAARKLRQVWLLFISGQSDERP